MGIVGGKLELLADVLKWKEIAGRSPQSLHRRKIHAVEELEVPSADIEFGPDSIRAHAAEPITVASGESLFIGTQTRREIDHDRLADDFTARQLRRTERVATIEDCDTASEVEGPFDRLDCSLRYQLPDTAGEQQPVITIDGSCVTKPGVARNITEKQREPDRVAFGFDHNQAWRGADATGFRPNEGGLVEDIRAISKRAID